MQEKQCGEYLLVSKMGQLSSLASNTSLLRPPLPPPPPPNLIILSYGVVLTGLIRRFAL